MRHQARNGYNNFMATKSTPENLMAASCATSIVYNETYKGYSLVITHTIRTGSVLMDSEYQVFVGGDIIADEMEVFDEAVAKGRRNIDLCVAA